MNKLICGDNLEVMEGLADASIDLICTDPPFCSQRDYGAFNDKWDDGLKGYLKFMRPRVEQMHRLLKETGSLYLHCDPSASHYLKVMLDEVFGRKQFRNEIVWAYPASPSATKSDFPRKNDILFRYVMSKAFTFNDNDIRIPYAESSQTRVKYPANKSKVMSGTEIKLNPIGKMPCSVWTDIQQSYRYREHHTGWPTQKPEELYQRMIKASSNEGDIVLDPFCGSGTTCVAANNLGRYYIGIDEKTDAIEIAEQRLAQQNLFTG